MKEKGTKTKKKVLKWIAIGLPFLLIAFITFVVGGSYIEHQNLIEEEKAEYPAPGKLVDINDDGNKLHVYTEGKGSETLVFLSGFGTSSPVFDFQALYRKLSNEYRIAVVERAGYGWSDITDSSRDIDTVLEETRTALQMAGESPPYVLFPHSLAGMEAIYWSHRYPEEIKMIMGLETLVPEYYAQTEEDPTLSPVISFLARTGLIRSQPNVCRDNFPAIQKGHLNEEETKIACTIFFRRILTANMKDEADLLAANSQTVLEQGKSTVPFHVFISNEGGEKWKDTLSSYSQATGGENFILDGEHYIHLDQPDLIAQKSRIIINNANGY